jgi:phage replication O-like protein O
MSNQVVESIYSEWDEFNGKGFGKLYNPIMDVLYKIRIPATEAQVLWYIFRYANGYGNKFTKIAFHFFTDKTGIRKENIYRALRGLKKKNIIQKAQDYDGSFFYGLNPNCGQWGKESVKTDTGMIRIDSRRIKNDKRPVSNLTPFLHTRGSTDRIITDISYRDEWKEDDHSLDSMIDYAAHSCSLTIMGKGVESLKQLMSCHPGERIRDAMGNFALYQLEDTEGRRYPIGRTFDAFLRKFDLFVDADSVDRRIEAERRWRREHLQERAGPDRVLTHDVPIHDSPEDTEKEEQDSIRFMKEFTRRIEDGARERGIDVLELLGADRNALWKYNLFKDQLNELLKEPVEIQGGVQGFTSAPASLVLGY